MKKSFLILSIMCLALTSNIVFADNFDNLQNITPVQKQKLTQIQFSFKEENNALDMRIMEYNNKLNQLKTSTDKSPEQISLLTAAYERNLSTLKEQQKQLEQKTDALYKSVMTPEQYSQYKTQQVNVEDSFNKFLQK